LPYLNSKAEAPEDDEDDLESTKDESEHVGIGRKIKGEIKIIEGKILHKPNLVEEGRELKNGTPMEN
jgi:hypothetical protein